MKIFTTLLVVFLVSIAWADEIEISDPTLVAELVVVQEKLDSVSTAIMACLDSGQEHKYCMCKQKDKVIQFNTSVKNMFLNYPIFESYDLVRFKLPNGTWVNQNLKGIKKQASMNPSCS